MTVYFSKTTRASYYQLHNLTSLIASIYCFYFVSGFFFGFVLFLLNLCIAETYSCLSLHKSLFAVICDHCDQRTSCSAQRTTWLFSGLTSHCLQSKCLNPYTICPVPRLLSAGPNTSTFLYNEWPTQVNLIFYTHSITMLYLFDKNFLSIQPYPLLSTSKNYLKKLTPITPIKKGFHLFWISISHFPYFHFATYQTVSLLQLLTCKLWFKYNIAKSLTP